MAPLCFLKRSFSSTGVLGFEKNQAFALENIKLLSDQGVTAAQCHYGRALIFSESGLENDIKEGVRLLTAASDKGAAFANYYLGIYFQKEGDVTKFLLYMDKAAQQHYDLAIFTLADWYSNAKKSGHNYNTQKALELLNRKEVKNTPTALIATTRIMNKENLKKPSIFNRKANRETLKSMLIKAEKGDSSALRYISQLYYQGHFGFKKNPAMALALHKMSTRSHSAFEAPLNNIIDCKISQIYNFEDYDESSLNEIQSLFMNRMVTWLLLDKTALNKLTDVRKHKLQSLNMNVGDEFKFLQGLKYLYGFCDEEVSVDKAQEQFSEIKETGIGRCYNVLLAMTQPIDGIQISDLYNQLDLITNKESQPMADYCKAKLKLQEAKNWPAPVNLEAADQAVEPPKKEPAELRAEAKSLLTQAAKEGYPPAQYCLGALTLKSTSDKPSKETLTLIRSAADQGFAAAQYLRHILQTRHLIPKMKFGKDSYLKAAAKQKYLPAMHAFAEKILKSPTSRRLRTSTAIGMLLEAAEHGNYAPLGIHWEMLIIKVGA